VSVLGLSAFEGTDANVLALVPAFALPPLTTLEAVAEVPPAEVPPMVVAPPLLFG
jgi:hypothetical protein